MKTKEELAQEYADNYFEIHEINNYKALKQGFLAGYNACEQRTNNPSLFELKEIYYEERRKNKPVTHL